MALKYQGHFSITAQAQKWLIPSHCWWPHMVIDQLAMIGQLCIWWAGVHLFTPRGKSNLMMCIAGQAGVTTLLWLLFIFIIFWGLLTSGMLEVFGNGSDDTFLIKKLANWYVVGAQLIWYFVLQTECECFSCKSFTTFMHFQFPSRSSSHLQGLGLDYCSFSIGIRLSLDLAPTLPFISNSELEPLSINSKTPYNPPWIIFFVPKNQFGWIFTEAT